MVWSHRDLLHEYVVLMNSFVLISLCVFTLGGGAPLCEEKKDVLRAAGSVLSVVFTFIRPAGD